MAYKKIIVTLLSITALNIGNLHAEETNTESPSQEQIEQLQRQLGYLKQENARLRQIIQTLQRRLAASNGGLDPSSTNAAANTAPVVPTDHSTTSPSSRD